MMLPALAFIFAMNTAGALSANPLTCFGLLTAKRVVSQSQVESNFRQITEEIRDRGGAELLTSLNDDSLRIVIKTSRRSEPMVSARQSWLGNKFITLRALEFASPKEKQLLVWQSALALYQLQSRSHLWAARAMLTPDEQRRFDSSALNSDEAFEYFIYSQPREWREIKLRRLTQLEDELYQIFESLELLDAADVLPKNDPGRWWGIKLLFGSDASQAIAPNQKGFAAWKEGKHASNLHQRHGKSLLLNYYMNFAKRAMVAVFAVQLALAAPSVTALPKVINNFSSFSQMSDTLKPSAKMTEDLNARYLKNIERQVLREESRLIKEIEKMRAETVPDAVAIAEREDELKTLREDYPWLVTLKDLPKQKN